MSGDRVHLRELTLEDGEALLDFRLRNREFLGPFDPARPDEFFTLGEARADIERDDEARETDRGYRFGIFARGDGRLVGHIGLSNLVRRAWQNATLGYAVDREHHGRGYATEAVRLIVEHAFDHLELHRVEAGVMPRNGPSIRVLEKNGFRLEGLAKRYLKINDVWEDHNLYALTTEDRSARG